MSDFLWVEKYRPQKIDDCILPSTLKETFQQIVETGEIPNMLFTGTAGLGKTTVAKALCNELDLDWILINGSEEGNIDTLRNKIKQFASTVSLQGGYKVVILDEADYLNAQSFQPALRGFIEEFANNCRFILTCNYPNRIIPAIHSRCQGFEITKQDQVDFTARVAEILISEGAVFELETIDALVRTYYPDLRKTINTVQMNTVDGVLQAAEDTGADAAEWRTKMVELFKAGKIKEAREFLIKNAQTNEYEEIYTWLYRNLDLYTANNDQYDECVLAIRNGLVKHTQVADVEINLSATMIEVARALG